METLVENLVGRTVRGYLLHDMIGEGGFGAVYRATQTTVDREVAIKVILPQYANRPEFIRKFEAEARLVARLEHPHIVPLFDYWRDPEGAYLVLRWMKGGTLRDSLRNDGAWTPRATARLFTQVAAALAVAHRNNVVHRDVKPANILLDEEKMGYLSDFGIAMDTMETEKTSTGAGGVTGSAGYISPEQINMQPVTPRSDIYSMTIVLYEMLAGHHPYPDSKSAIALFIKHTSEPLPPLRDFPDTVNRVLQKGAAKNAEERYSDIMQMATEFKQAIAGADLPAALSEGGLYLEDFDTTSMQPALAGAEQAVNPYKGLRAFQESDADDFNGREALIGRLLDRMVEDHPMMRFLAVVGPSGSGKSSVVKAGLIPALRRGEILGSETWFIVEMLPGASPIQELADALLSITVNPLPDLEDRLRASNMALKDLVWEALPGDDDSELVLAIDQFEEVFTQGTDEERDIFLQNIYEAVMAEDSRLRVIVTMRADFYDRPLMVQKFSGLMQQRTEVVVPMTIEELQRAVTAPARRVNVFFQQGLAAAIVTEVAEQPGVLPMLQYALTELFEKRESGILTLSAYQELGGVLGALARRADEIYTGLNPEKQEATRQLFLRLVTLGEGTEDTRRRALVSEILSASKDPQVMQEVIDTFGKSRLLTFDRDPITRSPTTEVAHEALIREWKRLRTWLDEGREDVRFQRLLSAASAEWDNSNRERSFLLRGGRLAQFEEWIGRSTIMLTRLDQEYLNASIEERKRFEAEEAARIERERQLELRARQRARVLAVVMFAAGVIGIVLSIFAFNQSAAADIARATSVADAATAVSANENAQTQAAAAATSQNNAEEQATLAFEAQQTALYQKDVASTAQANSDVNAAEAGTRAAEASTAQANADVQRSTADAAATVALNQANVASTANANAQLRATDAIAAQNVALTQEGIAQGNFNDAQTQVAIAATANALANAEALFSQSLALAASAGQLAGSNSPLALRLAIEANNVPEPALQAERTLISIVYNAPRRQFVSTHGAINSIVILPLDSRAVTGNSDGTLTVWDIASGQPVQDLTGHTDAVNQVAISPDGQLLASASEDGTVIVWNVLTLQPVLTFQGHNTSPVNTVVFNPTSTQLASGSDDGRVLVWNPRNGNPARDIPPFPNPINSLSFSSEGRYLLIVSDDALRAWELGTNNPRFFEATDTRRVKAGVFSPTGDFILTSGIAGSGVPELWDTASLAGSDPTVRVKLSRRLSPHAAPVNTVAFNRAGELVVTGSDDFALIVSDVRTGIELKRFTGHTNRVNSAVFSRDGLFILSGSGDGIMYMWDVAPSAQASTIYGNIQTSIASVLFTPGGNVLAATDLGEIRIWNTETEELVLTRNLTRDLARTDVPQSVLVLSPLATDDNLRALWGTTNLRLVNLTTGEELLTLTVPPERAFDEERAFVNDAAFSPDGTLALWGGAYFFRQRRDDFTRVGILRLYNLETGQLVREFNVTRTLLRPPEPGAPPEEVIAEGNNHAVTAVAFSPDGTLIASGFEDGRLYLWNVATGERIREYNGHSGAINQIVFTKDGLRMLTASADRAVILWDVNSGLLLRRYSGHSGSVNSIALSRTESTFISASEDRSLRLWDTATGDSIQRFGEQDMPITSVVFSPDGAKALAGSLGGRVVLSTIDTADSLKKWALENRYIPELSCSEREQFRLQPLCDLPTATPAPTSTPLPPVTATPGPRFR